MYFAITIILFLLLCCVIKFVWEKRKLYAFTWNKPGPLSIPIFGSLILYHFRKDHIRTVDEYLKEYPKWFLSWFLYDPTIITDDPEFIECILSKSAIGKPPRITNTWVDAMGEGVITMPAVENIHIWKTRHKIISTSLKLSSLKNYFDIMYTNNVTMIKYLKPYCTTQEQVDLELYCYRTFASSASESLFHARLDYFSGEKDMAYKALLKLDDFVLTKVKKFWLEIPILYKYTELKKVQHFVFSSLYDLSKEIYEQKEEDLKYKETHDLDENVMIEGLLKAVRGGFLTKYEAENEIMNMWPAGVGTVVTSVGHLISALAMNSKCQTRLFEELYDFYHTIGQVDVKYEHLDTFPYLGACCKEILRLFPAGPLTVRRSVEDVVYKKKNLTVPAGVNFILPTYRIHRDPKLWDDPDSFKPERWLDPVAMAKIPSFVFLPFSYGPRQCSGRHFAQFEMKLSVIQLLMSYEFHSHEKFDDIPVHTGILVRFDRKITVGLSERRAPTRE